MDRFCVNLKCDTKASSDIAFHFNPRYCGNSGHVVCNTLQSSCWGSEQRTNHTPLPRGFDFTLTILVNRDSYSVWKPLPFFLLYLLYYIFTFPPSLNLSIRNKKNVSYGIKSIKYQSINQVIRLTL